MLWKAAVELGHALALVEAVIYCEPQQLAIQGLGRAAEELIT